MTILFFYKEGSKDCERVSCLLKRSALVFYLKEINVEEDSALVDIDRFNVCMVPTIVNEETGKKVCGKNITDESLFNIL